MGVIQSSINQLIAQGGLAVGLGNKIYKESPRVQGALAAKQALKLEQLAGQFENADAPVEPDDYDGLKRDEKKLAAKNEAFEIRGEADKLRTQALYAYPTQENYNLRKAGRGVRENLGEEIDKLAPEVYEKRAAKEEEERKKENVEVITGNAHMAQKGGEQVEQKNAFQRFFEDLKNSKPTKIIPQKKGEPGKDIVSKILKSEDKK